MGTEQRKNRRVLGYAKALHVPTRTPGYIRDLSSTGCQVAFMQPLPVHSGDTLDIMVMAEHDPTIAAFAVRLTARWVKADAIWFSVGGETTGPESGTDRDSFAALVSYYEENT